MKKTYKFYFSLLYSILLVGCTSGGIVTPSGYIPTDKISAFQSGEVRLTCGISCAGSWGGSLKYSKSLFDNGLWVDLAELTMDIGYNENLSYFYLGVSAEELGFFDAAETYYRLALSTSMKCGGWLDTCEGFKFPDDIHERLRGLNIKNPPRKQPTGSEKVTSHTELSLNDGKTNPSIPVQAIPRTSPRADTKQASHSSEGTADHAQERMIKESSSENFVLEKYTPEELFKTHNQMVHFVKAFDSSGEDAKIVAQGSGVAISPRLLITNHHVVQESDVVLSTNVPVRDITSDNEVFFWIVIKADKDRDLALLQLVSEENSVSLPHVSGFSPMHDLSVGQSVWAIGAPAGLEKTFSEGIISGFRDSHDLGISLSASVSYIQNTAHISPGSSGGALFDSYGNLVGIPTFYRENAQGLNFALTMDELAAFIQDFKQEIDQNTNSTPHEKQPKAEGEKVFRTRYRSPLEGLQ